MNLEMFATSQSVF